MKSRCERLAIGVSVIGASLVTVPVTDLGPIAQAAPVRVGWVTGEIYLAGGPPATNGKLKGPVAGVVSAYALSGRLVARRRVGRDQDFRLALAPGRYYLRASSDCERVPLLLVRVRRTTRANVPVGCSIP